jgi:AcrR family transcriptional regulator
MKARPKLSSEERRAAIIQAVRRVFAEKGFHGTTTRELAQAAGVSEALLFKHFPNKEALYSAMLLSCKREEEPGVVERLKALEPSTTTLVVMVHRMLARFIDGPKPGNDEAILIRLIQRSMMEDGEFARLLLKQKGACWLGKVEECLRAAVAAGDATPGPVLPDLAGRFAENLGVMILLQLLPATPVVDYGVSRKKLTEQAVWFALRGLGLKEEAIRRCYTPEALAPFAR